MRTQTNRGTDTTIRTEMYPLPEEGTEIATVTEIGTGTEAVKKTETETESDTAAARGPGPGRPTASATVATGIGTETETRTGTGERTREISLGTSGMGERAVIFACLFECT